MICFLSFKLTSGGLANIATAAGRNQDSKPQFIIPLGKGLF